MLALLVACLFGPIVIGLVLLARGQPAMFGREKIITDVRRQLLLPSALAGGLPLAAIALASPANAGFALVSAPFVISTVAFGIGLILPGELLLRRARLPTKYSHLSVLFAGLSLGAALWSFMLWRIGEFPFTTLFGGACGLWTALVWALINRRRLVAWSSPRGDERLDISA